MTLDLFDRPSTADTGERSAFDLYETPVWMTAALLHHHPILGGEKLRPVVFEPCVGDGAIAHALTRAGCRVITNDIDPRHQAELHQDARQLAVWSEPILADVDWVISNTTFSDAFEILEQAERLARVGVAFLLRKTFLEPTKERGAWLSIHPPTRIIGLQRHRFRGKGQDSVSCDWCIWERKPNRALPPIVIDHHSKKRRIA